MTYRDRLRRFLSEREIDMFVERLKTYPAGIPEKFWGHGPMAVDKPFYNDPIHHTREKRLEYG